MAELTAEQRAALAPLTPKRRAFVLAYVGEARGSVTEAARLAGYAKPHPEGARLLRDATAVREAIEALRAPAEAAQIATMEALRGLWSSWATEGVMRRPGGDEEVLAPKDRIKAAELLAKSLGGFVERKELSGPGGAPFETTTHVVVAPEVARTIAREGDPTT